MYIANTFMMIFPAPSISFWFSVGYDTSSRNLFPKKNKRKFAFFFFHKAYMPNIFWMLSFEESFLLISHMKDWHTGYKILGSQYFPLKIALRSPVVLLGCTKEVCHQPNSYSFLGYFFLLFPYMEVWSIFFIYVVEEFPRLFLSVNRSETQWALFCIDNSFLGSFYGMPGWLG